VKYIIDEAEWLLMSKRTVRDFKSGVDLLPTVDDWAKAMGYALKKSGSTKRLYQKGSYRPMMLEFSQTGRDVHLEAWARFAIYHAQKGPFDVGLESGGFIGAIARDMARLEVNQLLTRISQPLIQ
jgi:hypothetical protein